MGKHLLDLLEKEPEGQHDRWSRASGEELPWWSSGKEFAFQCRGCGSIPGQGTKIPHAVGQLSQHAATWEDCTTQLLSPCTATREARAPKWRPSRDKLKKKKSKWRMMQMIWEKKPESTGTLWTVKKDSVLPVNVGRRTWMKYVITQLPLRNNEGKRQMKKRCVCAQSLSQGSCGERNVLLFPACFCES